MGKDSTFFMPSPPLGFAGVSECMQLQGWACDLCGENRPAPTDLFSLSFLLTLLCLQWDPSSGVHGWEAPLHEPVLPDPLLLPHSRAQAGLHCQLRQRQKAVQTHHSRSQLPGRGTAGLSRFVEAQVSLLLAVIQRKGNNKVSTHKVCLTRDLFLLPLSPLASGRIAICKQQTTGRKILSFCVSWPCNSCLSKPRDHVCNWKLKSGNWITNLPTAA